MWIERPPAFFRLLFPGALFRERPSGKKPGRVYLTFDDGPIPEVTPWVLDVLDEFQAKATFFMVGQNVERYPGLLKEVKRRGHRAGNHTLHHIRGLGLSKDIYLQDAEAGEMLTGSKLFRPPHGYISPAQLRAVKDKYRVVMYDLVTRDYDARLSPDRVVDNVKKYARDGAIIVFHDSLKSFDRLRLALPESLRWLREQGYEFALLEEKSPE